MIYNYVKSLLNNFALQLYDIKYLSPSTSTYMYQTGQKSNVCHIHVSGITTRVWIFAKSEVNKW